MSVLSLCNDVMELQEYRSKKDDSGGPTITDWFPVVNFTDVPCSAQPAGGSDVRKYHNRQIVVSHSIYVPWPLPMDEGRIAKYRIRVYTDGGLNNGIYLIRGYGNSAGRGTAFQIDCERTE